MGDFSLVSGMRIPFSASSVDAAGVPAGGAFRDFHGGGAGPLLCGTRSPERLLHRRSATSDQIVAGFNTPGSIGSLVVRAQPSLYLSGYSFSGRQYISYKGDARSDRSPDSPSIVYHSLFDGFTPVDASARAQHDFDLRARKSVLDSDLRQARARARHGRRGRSSIRLERHFDEIRDLETAHRARAADAGGQCQAPDRSRAPILPVGGDNAGAGSDTIATNTGYSDEHERARVMADLIHMAFVCDLTRAATLQITAFQSHMNVYPRSRRSRSACRSAPTCTRSATTATPRLAGSSR